MIVTFIILIFTTFFFINGKFRADLVAIASLLALSLTQIITPTEALAGFSNSVVIMIAGLFVVGAGIFNTGLADQIGNRLLVFGGSSKRRSLLIIMLTVAVFSALMSNTGTVAVLLPVVISMAVKLRSNPGQFLIPLAFASSMGGVLTIIGTPPNLVVSEVLQDSNFSSLGFFSLFPIGVMLLIVGIIYMLTIGRSLLPSTKGDSVVEQSALSASELAGIYNVYNKLHFVKINEQSRLIGEKLAHLKLPNKYGITVIVIDRVEQDLLQLVNKTYKLTPKPSTVFSNGDHVLLFGNLTDVERFIDDYDVTKITQKVNNSIEHHFLTSEFGLTEAIVTPHSNFNNKTIRELKFRKQFGCSVLALNRRGEYIQIDAGKIKLRPGDALLIHGQWEKIELLAEKTRDIVVLGRVSEEASTATAVGKAPIAGLIMLLMLVLMSLEILAPVITVMLAAFLMIVTGCLRSIGDAYNKINWESVILIGAMLPMATALEKTGGVNFLSETLVNLLGAYGPLALLTGFLLLTMILSQFISNTATAVILAPVALMTAVQIGVSPYPFVIGVAASASMAFSTPVASPTNALVMTAGNYTFKDFVKIGIPLQIITLVVLIILLPIFYPF